MSKKFAVFDIDGTIFRWQLYHELFDEFHRRGIVSNEDFLPIFTARSDWRDKKIAFEAYEEMLVKSMERCIVGISESTLIEAADQIIASKGNQTYRYTTQLISELKEKGYTILAISGSHQQAIERFASLHGIDIAYGRTHTIRGGLVTSETRQVYGFKAEILRQLVDEHQLDWGDSYAIGDTKSDADMMELVTNPIAFNPDQALYERARKEHWPIVIERKNMIYKLESNGNTFVLA